MQGGQAPGDPALRSAAQHVDATCQTRCAERTEEAASEQPAAEREAAGGDVGLQPGQRDSILKNVRTAIDVDTAPKANPGELEKRWRALTPESDEVVETLTHFIKAARSEAPNGFGRTVDQKLFILGYIAGVVNFVANSSMMLKIRFLDYLKATLHWSGVLDSDDVKQAMKEQALAVDYIGADGIAKYLDEQLAAFTKRLGELGLIEGQK